MKKKSCIKLFFASLLMIIIVLGIKMFFNVQFDRNCEGYLKQAADANTIELAEERLEMAVSWLEKEGINEKSGYTSVFYNTPEDDIGFWFRNLNASLKELKNLSENVTSLEESNMLIKLRETLLDQGSKKTEVTVPKGMSVYPYNLIFFLFFFLGIAGMIVALIWDKLAADLF